MIEEEKLHHYCIIRKGLPVGVIAAQLVHAAGESNPEGKHSYSVVLCANKDKLEIIESKLKNLGVSHVSVRETDAPYNGELLAIGINPFVKENNPKLKQVVKRLSLLKGDEENED